MNLAKLTTEGRNPNSTDLDRLSAPEIVRLMNQEDQTVPAAVAAVEEEIAAAIEIVAARLQRGGRLIYLGAGTSGRLGVLDAAECPPTFNSPPWQVAGLIAGGPVALTRAVEGAEDHPQLCIEDLQRLDCSASDVVVGIATSGRTPYVLGGLEFARSVGAATIGLSCNEQSALQPLCDVEIAPIVGPEVVTGSTRLKAGTATKLVLNMLSTGAMVKLGKTYGNLMVDLQATNEKLADRSERLVAELANVSREQAAGLLSDSDGDVKTAVVSHRRQISATEARQQLHSAHGRLRNALEANHPETGSEPVATAAEFVLGVDGGGTKTLAWLAAVDSATTDPLSVGQAGASNPQSVGWAAALANIDLAIGRAFANAEVQRSSAAAVTLSVAGTGSDADQQRLLLWSQQQRIAERSLATHDALPILSVGTAEGVGVAVIGGTGSFVFGKNEAGETARAGGWGHTVGDEGSGYAIGLAGLRAVMRSHDGLSEATGLAPAICSHFGIERPDELRTMLAAGRSDVSRIAALAPIVIAEADAGDAVASQIRDEAAIQLAMLVKVVASRLFNPNGRFELAIAGGVLVQSEILRCRLAECLESQGVACTASQVVAEPIRGAIVMARQLAAGQST